MAKKMKLSKEAIDEFNKMMVEQLKQEEILCKQIELSLLQKEQDESIKELEDLYEETLKLKKEVKNRFSSRTMVPLVACL